MAYASRSRNPDVDYPQKAVGEANTCTTINQRAAGRPSLSAGPLFMLERAKKGRAIELFHI